MNLQAEFHDAGYDYEAGSPHLRHGELRATIERSLRSLVHRSLALTGRCRVLELGAGHGTFTTALRQAGASVVVTEMSKASAYVLTDRFADDPQVSVELDDDGEWIFRHDEAFDLAVCVSVLHHIPDYLRTVDRLASMVRPGGAFVSWMDPTWYPTMPLAQRALSTGSYFAWRLTRGDLKRGLATRVRRLARTYDENRVEDMVEYHVVRDGVDQAALVRLLEQRFGRVELTRYWATQAAPLQRLGDRLGLVNVFGIEAIDHH